MALRPVTGAATSYAGSPTLHPCDEAAGRPGSRPAGTASDQQGPDGGVIPRDHAEWERVSQVATRRRRPSGGPWRPAPRYSTLPCGPRRSRAACAGRREGVPAPRHLRFPIDLTLEMASGRTRGRQDAFGRLMQERRRGPRLTRAQEGRGGRHRGLPEAAPAERDPFIDYTDLTAETRLRGSSRTATWCGSQDRARTSRSCSRRPVLRRVRWPGRGHR